jgi:hypothetical protein
LLKSNITKTNIKKRTYSKDWERQLRNDVKELEGHLSPHWLVNPSPVHLPDDPNHRPKIMGRRT